MKRFLAMSAFTLFLLMLPGASMSDTLVLQDGTRISGVLLRRTPGTITFKNSRGVVHRYKASQVQNVELASRFNKTNNTPTNYGSSNKITSRNYWPQEPSL